MERHLSRCLFLCLKKRGDVFKKPMEYYIFAPEKIAIFPFLEGEIIEILQ